MAQNTLEIVAKVKADVSEAQKQFQKLFAQFQNFKLDKNTTSDIVKSFTDLDKAFNKLQLAGENIINGKATVEQLKNIGRASQDVDKAIANLNHNLNRVGEKNFELDLNTPEIIKAQKDIDNLSKALSDKYGDAVTKAKKAQADLANSKYTKKIGGYSEFINSLGAGDLEKAQENFQKLQNNIETAGNNVAGSIKTFEDKIANAISGKKAQKTALGDFSNKVKQELDKVKADLDNFSSSLTPKTSKGDIFSSLIGRLGDDKGLKAFKSQLEEVKATLTNFTPSDAGKLQEQLAKVWETYTSTARPGNISSQAWSGFRRAFQTRMGQGGVFQELINSGTTAQQKVDELKAKLSTFGQEATNLGIASPFTTLIKGLTADKLDITNFDNLITQKIQKLNSDINDAQTKGSNVENLDKYRKQAEALKVFKDAIDDAFGTTVQTQIRDTNKQLGEATNQLNQEKSAQIQGVVANYKNFANAMGDAGQNASSLTGDLQGTTEAIARQKEELGQVVSRFAQFGTMAGILRTFGRVVRSAFQSVKELDEAMNNIAVVTDYTTKDLWNQIDAYTAMAQATGSTIKGSYEVAQLYYQQGLTDAEVMAAANETLKMARISNIDYAKATDYATAAIKGFGLAYQDLAHINDVYSNLAAKTAADTEEISIAMSKVASIAHSTGMELETTAAFLTQIIATTREAPETAGTALKTVIARFAEVKKLISQGEVTGTDEEGTEVSVNKIEEALKTAGVALRDTTGQMRDLDDVFIELASRWDSLDTLQQRYIATQAAGSRQQSRFLAMMNDYEGLQETLGYAMDSAGASQEQFNKTLDSLQSKLNNLSNAWTEFTTGIMNADFIKGGVDILTKILDVINDITGALGSGGSTISKILLTFSALRYGTGAAGNFLGWLGVPNQLPTMKDQWNTGLFSKVFTSFQAAGTATKLQKAQALTELQNFQQTKNSIIEQFFAAEDAGDILQANELGVMLEDMNAQLPTYIENVKKASKTTASFWSNLSGIGKASIVIAGILAVVAAIQLGVKAYKAINGSAEEFQQTLSELQNTGKEIKDLEKTLSNLRAYQEGVKDKSGKTVDGMDDFATLQKGVGSYGQNISLTNEQYSRYLEICDAIVALNPDIAKGYNSNAEAIAKNASALEDLIAKQEEQIRNKAIQTAIIMDDKFYKDAKTQAKETQEEINTVKIKRSNLNQQYFSTEDLTQTGILTNKEFEALRKGGLSSYNQSLKELTENEEKYRQQIKETVKDIDIQELALSALTKISTYYGSSLDDLNGQIELSSKALEAQKDDIKEQWTAMLPGIDGWYELSDAQQAFIRKSIRGMDIDLFDDSSMKQQEQEIKNWVRDVQALLSNTESIAITFNGETTPYLMKDIVDALGSGEFDRLGLTAGLDWLNGFYQGLLSFGESHPELQNGIMKMFGFEGTWEDFGKQTSSQFAEQVYGTSYTDRVEGIEKTSVQLAEEKYGSYKGEGYKNEQKSWQSFLEGLDGETADTIVQHYDEIIASVKATGKAITQETLVNEGQKLLEIQQQATEIIQQGVDRGLDEERIKNYISFLQKVGSEELRNNQALAAQVALRAMLYDQAVENVNTNLDSWKQASERSEMNPEEWANAQSEAKQALADLLTVDIETLPENLEITADMLDEIGKLAKGDTKAFQKMIKTLAKKKVVNFGIDFDKMSDEAKDAWDEFEKLSDEFTQKSMDVAIGTSLDDAGLTDYANQMTKALLEVGLTADQVGEVMKTSLSGQGYEPVVEVTHVKAGEKYTIPTVPAFYKDPLTGEITTGGITGGEDVAEKDMDIISINGSTTIKNRDVGSGAPSGGGGGGGGSKPTKPKQDPFYNYIKTVDDYKKRLESLQDVQELLTKPVDIFNNTKAQEDYYKTLLGSNQSYLNHVNSELERLQKEAQSKYSKYIEVSVDGSLRLTEEYWASTGDITEELDEWIDAYDDVLGRQKDLTDEINDYKKELKELWEGWRDSFIDLTNDIADVFQELDEKQLEDRQEFYEKLEEQDQRYLESVRNNIEEERKARERANSFEDLQKKQNRLALLQRDSSGRYANDIAELQEEINSDQQDLADQNVDNILDTLEKQMDKDAERHQDILDAMQKQIDSNVENRIYIERAEQTIAQGEQAILDAIHMGEDWRNASNAEREKMDEEQATNIAGSKSYLEKLNEGITSSSEYISKMVTDALTKQTEKLVWTIGDIPQNDEAHVAHAMETTLPSILEQFFARTNTAQDMADDNATNKAKKYATGGLVNYTGPAWVDGTPGKPEAFLNANQTAMIASFTANLAKMISGKFPSSNVEAGSNCEINIDIGSIGADYDIDQAINKVKQEIVNSAQFRNVTLLNRRR